ncbi:AAA family ATPase [Cocleimonas flava]|uniref:Double zinc ribbon protein n=1 Tax=Cocleimonas flava TaxID=634765 RepID=A0A4R1EN30_9GAMM|nr:adenylate/guanylate cyclase domain-containing protein [Cocleimonas flava]TCJ82616.1 double zinc ribbon protein [Cocleimonas flava]
MKISCNDCGVSNNPQQKFCKGCGVPLARRCTSCGFKNQLDANFCGGCGLKLDQSIESVKSHPEAERRQLTVMQCDLVGSSELAEQFDPEDLRDLLRSYQQCIAEVTLRYGGHIAKYIGDGLLIYFGHPHAHEDDAKRSILTGLGVIERIEKLNETLIIEYNVKLKVRIGIHTGLVVIGQMGSDDNREENAIVGETPNIAARIEHIAEPNTIAISEDTNDLVKGLFITQNLGQQSLKGVSQNLTIFKVIAESDFLNEFDVRRKKRLLPIIGRNRELDIIAECWEQAKSGRGQIVHLTGEAGVGKSRIVSEFMRRVDKDPQHLRLYQCSSVHTNTAFHPIVTYLKYLLNLKNEDTDEVKYKRLEAFFDEFALPLGKYAPLFAPLLGVKVVGEEPVTLNPDKTKQIIFQAWVGLMQKMADEHPLLLIFEDTHWIDPSTQEMLDVLGTKLASKRILFFITSRPGYKVKVDEDVVLKELVLKRLDQESSYSMISQLAGDLSLPDELIRELVVKTDGIPLFIEELTKTVIDSGLLTQKNKRYELAIPLSSVEIPTTLKDSLMARLDQLSSVKKITQLAATIGRQFSFELLRCLPVGDVDKLDEALEKLISLNIIEQKSTGEGRQYEFRHALLQETAYKSLLKSTRRRYHGLIADAIVEHFPNVLTSEPEVLATHYIEANKVSLAVDYLLLAGNQATLTSSHHEAISHLSKGVELLSSLPQIKKVMSQEFQLQVRLIGPLIAAQSYVSPLVEKAFTRALKLSKKLESSPEIFPVLHGRYAFYQVCGLIHKAESLVDEFVLLAKSHTHSNQYLEMVGNRMRGSSLLLLGESKKAETYFKNSLKAYSYEHHKGLDVLYGQDIKVTSLVYLILNQWHQGKFTEMLSCSDEARELAENIGSANTIGISNFVGKVLPLALLDETEAVIEACNKTIEDAMRLETPLWKIGGLMFKGWAMVRLGRNVDESKQGMDILEQGLSAYNSMNLGLFRPYIMIIYAQACMRMGYIQKGLDTLEQSLKTSEIGGEHWVDAETYRTIGELLLNAEKPKPQKAKESFEKALKISLNQGSLSQELRAAMSLLRLADQAVEVEFAKKQLQLVYDKFENKEHTKDLLQAEQLLNCTASTSPLYTL